MSRPDDPETCVPVHGLPGDSLQQPQRPDIRLSRVFDLSLEIVWFLISMGIFRPLVNRHFLRRLPWEIDKNLHRLAAQWSQAATTVIDDLAQQGRGFMREELATIEGLISPAEDQRPAAEQALAALDILEGAQGGPGGQGSWRSRWSRSSTGSRNGP